MVIYQLDSVSVEVSFHVPQAAGLETSGVAKPHDGEAVLGGERHAEERLLGLQVFEIGFGARFDVPVSIFGFNPRSLESFKSKVES